MPYLIRVFNTTPISLVDPQDVLAAITESNYQTLCLQYGLDPALIKPGLARLGVLAAPDLAAPFFTVVTARMVNGRLWSTLKIGIREILRPSSFCRRNLCRSPFKMQCNWSVLSWRRINCRIWDCCWLMRWRGGQPCRAKAFCWDWMGAGIG